MNRRIYVLILVLFSLNHTNTYAQSFTDYTLFDHSILLDELRAGNHDESGTNQYYFKVTLVGLFNTFEEREKDLKSRQQFEEPMGEFADVSLTALSFLKLDKDTRQQEKFRMSINGNTLREMISHGMKSFGAKEDQIEIMTKIELWEKNKKFKFFGEDQLIGKTAYYPIPLTKLDVQGRTNLQLEIRDEKGTYVRFHVDYANPQGKGERVPYGIGKP